MAHRWSRILAFAVALATPVAASADYSCLASTTGTINFLQYNPTSATPSTASATATLKCSYVSGNTQSVAWTMQLSNGSSGNCAGRALPGPGASLSYNIYQNSVAGGAWGNAGCGSYPAGTAKVSNGQPTETVTRTLYGQIPASQFVGTGTYMESLTLTVTY